MLLATAALLLATAALPAMGNANPEERLAFDVSEGPNLNSFLREGPVAAHLLLRSGLDPRILIAFPAGNSGVGLWFSHGPAPLLPAGKASQMRSIEHTAQPPPPHPP